MKGIKILNKNIINKINKILLKEEESIHFIPKSKIKVKPSNLLLDEIDTIVLIKIILIFSCFILILQRKNNNHNIYNQNYHAYINYTYYACFVALGREENKYVRELVEYYSKIGVEKFIFGDNNLPNTEKLSDVLQDYIKDGKIDIIELFGSISGQSELYNITYEKYKYKCNWFLLFDFDEYLEVHFEENKTLMLKDFLSNEIFDECEAILFNWIIYPDNNLTHYDNRTLIERFTIPNYYAYANIFVKSVIRGGIDKTFFLPKKSNHVPEKGITICNSKGKIIKRYNPFSLSPPKYDYGYLKHFTTKTAEEYCDKIIKGPPRNESFNYDERVQLFFIHNKYSKEKMEIFEKKFNRTFNLSSI